VCAGVLLVWGQWFGFPKQQSPEFRKVNILNGKYSIFCCYKFYIIEAEGISVNNCNIFKVHNLC